MAKSLIVHTWLSYLNIWWLHGDHIEIAFFQIIIND